MIVLDSLIQLKVENSDHLKISIKFNIPSAVHNQVLLALFKKQDNS